jgi:hypothetical protein
MSRLDAARTPLASAGSAEDHLTAPARQWLDSLRAAFDERLMALERALIDPRQAASLGVLMLDLVRVAGDEAEAAARQACLEVKLEADRAAEIDRATIAELRDALDRLHAELERERHMHADARRAVRELEERTARPDEDFERLRAQAEQAGALAASVEAAGAIEALRRQLDEVRQTAEARAAEHRAVRAQLEQALRDAEARASASTAARQEQQAQPPQAATRRAKTGRARAREPWPEAHAEEPAPSLAEKIEKATGQFGEPKGQYATMAHALRAWSAEEPGDAPLHRPPARPPISYAIQIDGQPARLVDVSTVGGEAVTTVVLEAGRQVEVFFPDVGSAMAKVVWSRLEPPDAGFGNVGYRAGLVFSSMAPHVLEKLLALRG